MEEFLTLTIVKEKNNLNELFSQDIGPGNCLIDSWVRNNSNKKFDEDGNLALSGTKNEIIFEQAQELYSNRESQKKGLLTLMILIFHLQEDYHLRME